MLRRLFILGAAFSLELVAVTLWLDNSVLIGRHGLSALIGSWGAWTLRAIVAFAVFFLTFLWLSDKRVLVEAVATEDVDSRVNWRFAAGHILAISIFGALSSSLYGTARPGPASNSLAGIWLAAGLGAVAFGAFALIRPGSWLRMARGTGSLWLIALAAALLACLAGNAGRSLWPRAANITFQLTHLLVGLFLPGLIVNPAKMLIGTPRFLVQVAPECSGLEGIGLMLAFGIAWLTLFRRQCRFPQALLLLPAGATLIFLLNSVRIAALILIGNAGAERIAAGGFHSQAGWILFNLVALGFTVAAGRIPWISNVARWPATTAQIENPSAAWLMPFVTILAAGMLSRALTGDFEWLYPLRFFAAAAVLVYFRRNYAGLNWRIDWFGPAIGCVVFALWIGLDGFAGTTPETMPPALAMTTPFARNIWLAFRVLAAAVTVPVAEELAFRGFLYRRLQRADFESVSLRRFSWLAILISSAIFGMLHGSRWFVGAVAGGLYGLALLRRGRIGDAVAAHATTNALIAADVLALQHWHLW